MAQQDALQAVKVYTLSHHIDYHDLRKQVTLAR